MAFDKSDHDKQLNGRRAAAVANQITALRSIEQAAVAAAHVTGDPNWDRYLSYVTATTERIAHLIGAEQERLGAPNMVDQNEIMILKIKIADLQGMKRMADVLLALPKDIMTLGEQAKLQLEGIGGRETDDI